MNLQQSPVVVWAHWLALGIAGLVGGTSSALAWDQAIGYRSAPLPVPSSGRAGLTLLSAPATGISFTNHVPLSRYRTNQIFLNGSGVAAGDVDGDGWCDIYLCSSSRSNRLYRNLGGWRFEDVTDVAAVGCADLNSTGAALADLDGDGDLDLIVNSIGTGTAVYWNDGRGHFARGVILNPGKGGMSMALGDIDGDGDLDVYVVNYRTTTIRDEPGLPMVAGTNNAGQLVVKRVGGRPTTEPDLVGRFNLAADGRIVENGEPDAFYRNLGGGLFAPILFTDGTFLDETGQPLATPPYDWGLSVMFRDVSGDGLPDIYVCNDFESEDHLWISIAPGRFRAAPRLALRHTSLFSMGLDFADLNRDGFDDFFVADMLSRTHWARQVQTADAMPTFLTPTQPSDRPQVPRNTLFLSRGDGSYAEIAEWSGLEASDWSWAPIFVDVDLDGYEDLLVTTGHERDERNVDAIERAEALKARRAMSRAELLDLRRMFGRLATPNRAFRNRGDLTFEEVSARWGFDQSGVSQGMALADLDNDGDLDVVVNNLNSAASLYRNESSAGRLTVRLKGLAPNTRGIGSVIRVLGGPVRQSQEMICGGRYLSGDEAIRVFATGPTNSPLRVEVTWRSGRTSLVETAVANRVYEIEEPATGDFNGNLAATVTPPTLFRDVSGLLQHTASEVAFDDFTRQPLLPNRLSQAGPGVSWFDLDGDGWDDLIIGAGKGGRMALYLNNAKGGFVPAGSGAFGLVALRDFTSVLGWQRNGHPAVIAGLSSYEDGRVDEPSVRQWNRDGAVTEEWSGSVSAGALAIADLDTDGDLDLVVAGRCLPGRYPEAADTILWTNDGHRLVPSLVLTNVGLVNATLSTDLNGDGAPELVLACEWGPVRVFAREQGDWVEKTAALGLNRFLGWWNGVTAADFDNDGRLDLVASNWGLNHALRATDEHPHRLYYGRLGGAADVDLVEARYDEQLGKEVAVRGFREMCSAFPFLRNHLVSFEAFGKSSVAEVFGARLRQARQLEVNMLASSLFLNRGDHFERSALPPEAQFAPAFGICAGDVDGDGNEDLFLCQNFFPTHPGTTRHDAGRGLWLRGNGDGTFRAWSGRESGVRIYGDQRAAALADYDRDGRLDLAVTQNGGSTRLFQNTNAIPGLRLRLTAGPANPTGIGAVVRLRSKNGLMGPAREVHAGQGYWSQDSSVLVMTAPEAATDVWVRWPGGKTALLPVPRQARELTLDAGGALTSVK
ncbi:MAG: VCBS repeat-containing protein [Verrucomicrobiota bacterium]